MLTKRPNLRKVKKKCCMLSNKLQVDLFHLFEEESLINNCHFFQLNHLSLNYRFVSRLCSSNGNDNQKNKRKNSEVAEKERLTSIVIAINPCFGNKF